MNSVGYLKSTIQNGKTSVELAQDLALQAIDFVQSLIRAIDRVHNDIVALLLSLNGICPLQERVCNLTSDFTDSKCEGVDSNVTLITVFDEWRQDQNNNGEDVGFEIFDDDDLASNETTLVEDKTTVVENTMSFLDDFDFEAASKTVVDAATGTACRGLGIGTSIVCNANNILPGFSAERLARHVNTATSLQSDLYSLSDDIETVYELMDDMKRTATSFDWALDVAILFMVLSASIGLFFLCELTFPKFSSQRLTRCIQNCWIFPLFMFFTFLSLVFTCVFMMGSMAVSDFCWGGPEDRLLEVAAKFTEPSRIKLFASKSTYEL
jgi:hypothetical protein